MLGPKCPEGPKGLPLLLFAVAKALDRTLQALRGIPFPGVPPKQPGALVHVQVAVGLKILRPAEWTLLVPASEPFHDATDVVPVPAVFEGVYVVCQGLQADRAVLMLRRFFGEATSGHFATRDTLFFLAQPQRSTRHSPIPTVPAARAHSIAAPGRKRGTSSSPRL